MKIIIEGDLPQIQDACRIIAASKVDRAALAERRNENIITRRQKREVQVKLAADRTLLHRAYVSIMRDPDRKTTAAELVAVLAGRSPVTERLLETARQIVECA